VSEIVFPLAVYVVVGWGVFLTSEADVDLAVWWPIALAKYLAKSFWRVAFRDWGA